MRARLEGMALPLVLLLLLALTALGHGMLLLAQGELRASWAFRHAVRATRASEGALRLAFQEQADLDGERLPWVGLPLVSGELEAGLPIRGIRRWLGPEFFLLEGTGGSRGWPGERRSAWVGWSLQPEARIGSFSGVAEVGSGFVLGGEAQVGAEMFFSPPVDWDPEACRAYETTLDALFRGTSPRFLAPLAPWRQARGEPVDSIPPLGLLHGGELLSRAERDGSPARFPSLPGSSSGCPGGSGPVFHGTDGSLALQGGRVCGLLVVGGDLQLNGEASFQGLALVGGDLILKGESQLEGMARVGGNLSLEESARFLGSGCPVFRALEGLPVLREPVLLTGGYRLNGY